MSYIPKSNLTLWNFNLKPKNVEADYITHTSAFPFETSQGFFNVKDASEE